MLTYEEMGKLPADRSVIPSYCESFSESAVYVAEASTRYINDFFKEVGITELAIFESTGSVVVYEGAKLQAFKEKLAKVWDSIWKAVKGLFEKIANAFDSLKKNLDPTNRFNALSASHINGIDDAVFEKFFGKFKYVEYHYADTRLKIEEGFDKADSKVAGLFKEGTSDEEAKNNAKDFLDGVYAEVSGCDDAKDMESMKSALRKKLDEASKEVTFTKSSLSSELSNLKFEWSNGKDQLKKSYTKAKKDIDSAKKALNKIKDENMSLIQYETRCTQTAIMTKANALMVTYDYQKKAMRQAGTLLAIVKKLTAKDIKADKKAEKTANESTNFVEEAFQW